MTKMRECGSVEQAVDRARVMLGPAAQDISGRSEALLRAWGDPDNDTHHIPVYQAIRLDAAYVAEFGGKAPLFDAYERALTKAIYGLGGASPHSLSDPLDRISRLLGELSSVTDTYKSALHPNSPGGRTVTRNEAEAVHRQIQALRESLDGLTRDLDVLSAENAA